LVKRFKKYDAFLGKLYLLLQDQKIKDLEKKHYVTDMKRDI